MAAPEDVKERTIAALGAAKQFGDLYHDTFDKRRQALNKMYHEDAQLVWNGNSFKGLDKIGEFLSSLPDSNHTIEGMDTQPLITSAVGPEFGSSIVVTFFGTVKFKTAAEKVFNQTVILSVKDTKWKIVSDSVRFQE